MKNKLHASGELGLARIPVPIRFVLLGITVFLIVVACMLTFQIRSVTCEGNYIYTAEQVISASDISVGDNLMAIQKARSASLIMTKLPFVESVHIERQIPGSIVISITEREASFTIQGTDEVYYLIDGDGIVQGTLDVSEIEDYPEITGITISGVSSGTALSDCAENPDNVEPLLELLSYMDMYGVTGGIETLTIEAVNDISLNYDGRYDIYLGSMDNIEYKVASLAYLLSDWDSGRSGIIDLTFDVDDTIRFQPY